MSNLTACWSLLAALCWGCTPVEPCDGDCPPLDGTFNAQWTPGDPVTGCMPPLRPETLTFALSGSQARVEVGATTLRGQVTADWTFALLGSTEARSLTLRGAAFVQVTDGGVSVDGRLTTRDTATGCNSDDALRAFKR
jgi:hypothetical protein